MSMTLVGILVLVVLIVLGVPIYLGLLSCALIVMVLDLGIDSYQPLAVMFGNVANYNLLAIPLFVFLGQVLAFGGSGTSLIKLLNAFMGHLPGGPAYSLIFACVMVSAMCAHPIAAVASFGPLIIPILVGLGYSEVFAVGLLLCSASLAPLIPPNTIAIIYTYIACPVADKPINVTTLWTASIIPGLIIAVLLCIAVFIYSRMGHFKRLPAVTWAGRWDALKEGWPVALTPLVILGPLYANLANPTEVAAIGVIYVVLISRFFYRQLTWRTFWLSCTSTLRVLGAIFLLIMAAFLFTNVIVRAQVPQDITSWLTGLGLNWWTFMIMMAFVFFVMGMFLDPSAIVLVTVPMLLYTVQDLDINLYVYGVFTVIAVCIAGVTPPYGLTIFASQSILNKPYHFVVRACLMFLPALILGLILIAFIPGLSTWLPSITGR